MSFDEGVQFTVLETCLDKCLSEVVAVFEKVQDSSLHINHDPDYATHIEISKRRARLLLNWVVVIPLPARIDVASRQIHAPQVPRPRDVLIQVECVPTDTNDYFWLITLRIHELIKSVLEVEDVRKILKRNHLGLHWLWNLIAMPIKIVKLSIRQVLQWLK